MTYRWTKARCERELKDPANWEVTYTGEFIQEKQFEFYSCRFVRYEIRGAVDDWNHGSDSSEWIVTETWLDLGKTFYRTVLDDGNYALREISKPDAVLLMLDALGQEGLF